MTDRFDDKAELFFLMINSQSQEQNVADLAEIFRELKRDTMEDCAKIADGDNCKNEFGETVADTIRGLKAQV